MRDLTVPSGQPQLVGDFLIREFLQIAQHDGLAQASAAARPAPGG